MDANQLQQISPFEWRLAPAEGMPVPAIIFGDKASLRDMGSKVFEQIANVARLPGIVDAAYAMPDAHWGYGFPVGGVAAFDPEEGGVISAGGVGFDISCGVRLLTTGLPAKSVRAVAPALADSLFGNVPSGLGSH